MRCTAAVHVTHSETTCSVEGNDVALMLDDGASGAVRYRVCGAVANAAGNGVEKGQTLNKKESDTQRDDAMVLQNGRGDRPRRWAREARRRCALSYP